MSGLKITIPTSFTDASLPILRDDPILTNGSLALIEPAHPASPLAGVPVTGGLIPNIAHKESAAALSVTDDGLAAVFANNNISGAKGLIERTSLGGIHGIVSQNPGLANGDGATIKLPAAIRSYLYAQKSHALYFSIWIRTTRKSADNVSGMFVEFGGGNNTQKMAFFRADSVVGSGASQPNLRNGAPGGSVAPFLLNIAPPAGDSNTTATIPNAGPEWGPAAGTFNAAVPSWLTLLPSWVFYRMYVEDLTVSGRTYAQVDAIESALYSKHVLTAGGRYFGDTFTSPSTIS